MPPMVCKAVCTTALRAMLSYTPSLSRVRILCYAPQLERKKIPGRLLLTNRSDTVNLDALNLLLLFGDSKQLGLEVFLSDVEAAEFCTRSAS